jgi:ribonuclease R
MKQWIGIVRQSAVTGLYNRDLRIGFTGSQRHQCGCSDGDLVTVTEHKAHPPIDEHHGAGKRPPTAAESVSPVTEATNSITLLAQSGTPEFTVYQILAEKALDPHHPPACELEAQAWVDNPGHDTDDLQDLTHLPFVTIDNADSLDLDQALYIERDANDHLHIHYALADASHYVRPGSAIFAEAVRRAVTYYVPGLSVPMLPRALSEDLVSLNPDVVRRALLFTMTVDTNGEATDTSVSRVLIKSRAKLAYLKVQEYYDQLKDNLAHPYIRASYGESLLNLKSVGLRRIAHAQRRDVVDYNRREPRVTISSQPPAGFAIALRERCDCEKYNEQVSLLCNMEGARLLEQHRQADTDTDVQSIFRVHSPPMEERLQELRHTINTLCDVHQLDELWRWRHGQPLADYLSALPAGSRPEPVNTGTGATTTVDTGTGTSDAVNTTSHGDNAADAARKAAIRLAIERLILLTNRASFFTDEPGPHHALGVKSYARFSSPMREIAGIFTHKELLEAMAIEHPHSRQQDERLQDTIVTAANASKRLQKELDQAFHLMAIEHYLHTDLSLPLTVRPIRTATIMGMRGGKIYVNIEGFGADVKLYLSDLGKQYNTRYEVDDVVARPASDDAPVFRTGDRLQLRLLRNDTANSRFVLSPV